MAVSHYAYNLLKVPVPHGIITIHNDFDLAQECEINIAKLTDAVIAEGTCRAQTIRRPKGPTREAVAPPLQCGEIPCDW
jgi:hypothetical protein